MNRISILTGQSVITKRTWFMLSSFSQNWWFFGIQFQYETTVLSSKVQYDLISGWVNKQSLLANCWNKRKNEY